MVRQNARETMKIIELGVKSVLRALTIFLAVTFIAFCLTYGNGMGIARGLLGISASQETVAEKVTELGLDQPLLVQYTRWLSGLLTGDFGVSFFSSQPVTSILATRIPVTMSVVLITIVLLVILSALIGIAAAVFGGGVDRLLQFLATAGAAIPSFISAVVLISVFAVSLGLFPPTGYVPPQQSLVGWASSLVLPVTAILIGDVGIAAAQFRSAVKNVLEQDFVRTLRARGMSERAVVFRHVLRNAAGPGLTILSLQVIGLLGGVVIIEQLFALPGIAVETNNAAQKGDIPVVMGAVAYIVIVVVIVNLAADILNVALNPKARKA